METNCIYCGSPLIWQNDFSRDDVFCDGDLYGLVSYWQCSGCGKMYEISDPPTEENLETEKE